MNRREFVCAPLAAPLLRAAAVPRPNIVILLADDLGWNDVGYHGSEIRTPHIDRLAREGVRCERFCAFPSAHPRVPALMTGRSPMRFGVVYATIEPFDTHGVPVDEHFMAQSFQAGGYETAVAGKWHLGHTHRKFLPNRRGFEHSYGCLNGRIDYITKDREGGYDWHRDGKTVREPGYSTDQIAAEAVRLIRARDRARPLFLYVPFNAPHAPLHRPPRHWDDYAAIANDDRRKFAAMAACMDDATGRILDALAIENMERDTLVLFFSDNGGPTGIGARNQPLRGGKRSTFEGGLRVPAVMRWPGRLPAGGVSPQLITVMDIFPTFCAAAGIAPRNRFPLDGRNLWPAIASGKPEPREDDIYFATNSGTAFNYALYHGEWKLVRIVPRKQTPPANLLFRPADDPEERHNLAAQHRDLVKELAARIDRWRALYPADGIVRPKTDGQGPPEWAEAAIEE